MPDLIGEPAPPPDLATVDAAEPAEYGEPAGPACPKCLRHEAELLDAMEPQTATRATPRGQETMEVVRSLYYCRRCERKFNTITPL